MIRKLWDLMLTGIYTVPQALKILNEEWGYRDRHGKPVSRSCLYILLSNPFYYGYFNYKGKLYQGKHEPMITKEEFDKVQKLIHRPNVPHPHKHNFLYKDLLSCGTCNFSVTAYKKTKVYKRTSRIKDYTYYTCTKKNKNIPCDERPVKESDLKDQFLNVLSSVEIEQDFKDWAMQYYKELDEYEKKNVKEIDTSIQKAVNDYESRLSELIDLKLSKSISQEEFDKKRTEIIEKRDTFKKKLIVSDDTWLKEAEKKYSTAVNITKRFEKKEDDGKRLLIRSVSSNYLLKDRLVRPELEKPFSIFKDSKDHPEHYFKKLEPVNYPFLSSQTMSLAMQNPTWLPDEDLLLA